MHISRGIGGLISAVVVLAVFGSACARRPEMTIASAPAPAAPPAPAPARPAPAPVTPPPPAPAPPPVAAAPPAPAPAPAPAPRRAPAEFAANAEVLPIHFAYDRAVIRPEDAKILDANARWLARNSDHLLLIEGHCDDRGTNEYNLALGERRAKAARAYLVAQGVREDRISLVSYGEDRPLCSERTEACWSKNRSARFLVKPQ